MAPPNVATSCPLCLNVEDPAGMLTVRIESVVPKGRRELLICIRCADSVVDSRLNANQAPKREELSDARIDTTDSPGPGDSTAGAPAGGALVPADQPADQGSGEHRVEPEPVAGGEASKRRRARPE